MPLGQPQSGRLLPQTILSDGEAIDLSKVDDGVRQHAGKRKAGNAPSRSGSAKSPKRPGISPRRSLPNEVESEDDGGEDGGSRENQVEW